MKILVSLICCFLAGYINQSELTVQEIRSLFYAAEKSKNSFYKLSGAMKDVTIKSTPVMVCYKGVTEMMGAKYTISPFGKMNHFKKGKRYIEQAVEMDPKSMEIRFLRFSIQTNLPGFLGYDEDIEADKKFLLSGVHSITDKDLKYKMIQYLSSTKYCTAEEKKSIAK